MKAVDIVGSDKKRDAILPMLVEIELVGNPEDAFLKIRETLTRIGIASKVETNTLYQTAHILQKRGRYYILGFKSLYVLDGRDNNVQRGDIARQNKIIHLLAEWGLLTVKDPLMIDDPVSGLANLMIVPYKDKANWNLKQKYRIGNKK